MEYSPADVGCARYPRTTPDQLFSDPVPILTRSDEFDRPTRVTLIDRRPGADNGPIAAGVSVLPDDRLAWLLELIAPPMASDDARPRQSRLERVSRGEDDCLYLVVAFRRLLLCVHRPGETPPPDPITLPDGRVGQVVGTYPTWPRRYRVRLSGPPGTFASEFERYVTFEPTA